MNTKLMLKMKNNFLPCHYRILNRELEATGEVLFRFHVYLYL